MTAQKTAVVMTKETNLKGDVMKHLKQILLKLS